MRLGNGLWEHTNFNSRLQPTQIGLGTTSTTSGVLQLDYGYGATQSSNNGNITNQQIIAPGLNVTQNYTYDQVNRIKSASEGANWTQTYDYDVYGNRWINPSSSTYIPNSSLTPQSQSDFNASNNRLQPPSYGYDPAGNLTKDPTMTVNGMVYDAENRMVSYTKPGVSANYAYDGDGRRVSKSDATGTLIFVYNAAGQLIAEYSSSTPTGTLTTSYLTTDHLGSTRVVTDGAGGVKARHDYLPFGEEIGSEKGGRSGVLGYTTVDLTRQRFTGHERDNESGLDFMQSRYCSVAQGRFTRPDEPLIGQDEDDPQTWNLYTYTSNNPVNRYDPDGHRWFTKSENGKLVDIQWVDPNDDGTYTSPGEGYMEFVPTEQNPSLIIYNQRGTLAYIFGETPEGGPVAFSLSTGMVRDASFDIIEFFIPGRLGIKGIARAASILWAKYLARKAAKEVFETALAGGKHAGFLKNYLTRSKKEIENGIRSFKKEIAKHKDKIAHPEKHIKDWNKLDPRQREHLVNKKWPGDIQRHKEQMGILKELLKRK